MSSHPPSAVVLKRRFGHKGTTAIYFNSKTPVQHFGTVRRSANPTKQMGARLSRSASGFAEIVATITTPGKFFLIPVLKTITAHSGLLRRSNQLVVGGIGSFSGKNS
jgi:hypothetical protein